MTATTNSTTPVTPVMRLDQLTKRYGDHVAVDNLSVDVPPGVVAALYAVVAAIVAATVFARRDVTA
jgi:hypothetical protein